MGRKVELAIGALNGLVGDYLTRTGNGLATEMHVVRDGAPLTLSREALAAIFPEPPRKLVVLVHGLMSTEDVWRMRGGETYGSLLEKELGFAAFEVRYCSGLRISENGERLDALLGQLAAAYPGPIDEVALVGHSMGGLVLRSATHAGNERGSGWLAKVKKAFYLGSPHLGTPLERFGNALSWALAAIDHPITTLIAEIVNLRSGGVKDLRYGNLRREDWEGAGADALLQNRRHPVPLLPHIRHHLVAGSLTADVASLVLLGDALVPLRSAIGRAAEEDRCSPFPQEHVAILAGLNHVRLAHDEAVFSRIRAWCEEEMR